MKKLSSLLLLFLLPLWAAASGHTVTITSHINVACNGGNNGGATASVSGGTGPFTYNWLPSGGTNATATNLSANSYTVVVTDQSDMSTATATVTITQPPALSASMSSTPACACNGTATGIASGGTAVYTYFWSPGGGNTSTITNRCVGTYTFTVMDANGCSLSSTVLITSVVSTSMSSTPAGCSNCSGTASVVASGGNTPYTYQWNNSQTTSTATSLCPNSTYSVTVTDINGCSNTGTVTVANSSGFTIGMSHVSPTCNNNGSCTATPNGGVAPYTYSWSNGGTTPTISNLPPGIYHVNITDFAGCTISASDTINPNNMLVGSAMVNAPETCNGANGSLMAMASGGVPPYFYQWSNNATTQLIGGLASGQYSCTIVDNAGCVTGQNVFLPTVNPMIVNLGTTAATCNVNDGTASPNITSGTAPYVYSWSNSSTAPSQTGLPAGMYGVTVTDANGCMSSDTSVVHSACDNLVTGQVYVDPNLNCVYDSGDQPLSLLYVIATPGNYVTHTDIYGNYSLNIPVTGTFTISLVNANGYVVHCPVSGSTTVSFATMSSVSSGNDFAVHIIPVQNLHVDMTSTIARPGFMMSYIIHYVNYSTVAINSTLTLNYDPLLTFISSTTPPSGNTPPQLVWNLGVLTPNQGGTITVDMLVPTLQNGGCIGCQLTSQVQIDPIAGDVYPIDNSVTDHRIIQGSLDPNYKECDAPGLDPNTGDILVSDSLLQYTIHFQNTGTDTAFNILIEDTLSQYLDPVTVIPGGSSHPYFYSMSNGVMRFQFFNILLPDSNTNEPASHGFVNYQVQRQPGLPVGTTITNTAYIYFDFNPAIITNTTINTIASPLGITLPEQASITVAPNPFSDEALIVPGSFGGGKPVHLQVFDVSGRCVVDRDKLSGSTVQLSRNAMPAGIYECRLTAADGNTAHCKIIIQ